MATEIPSALKALKKPIRKSEFELVAAHGALRKKPKTSKEVGIGCSKRKFFGMFRRRAFSLRLRKANKYPRRVLLNT
jgi:hypothetical protein